MVDNVHFNLKESLMTLRYINSLFWLFCSLSLGATPKKHLQFGFSGSLSGHFGSYGTMICRGIQAAFKSHPCTLQGEKIHAQLTCFDDYGDAAATKKNILTMHKTGINYFIGVMGSRGVLSVLPLIEKQAISMFFPWGTDSKLQNPKLKNIINGLGLMNPQIDHLVDTIVEKKKLDNIAIFHADDNFSTAAATHCVEQLTKYNSAPLLVTRYNRYTLDLTKSLTALCNSDPRVIICISSNMPAVKIINLLFRKGFYGCSFYGIDSTFLVPSILATKGAPFSYSSTVPHPLQSSIALAKAYRHDLARFYPDETPSILSFAYYICGRLIIDAINNQQNANPEAILKALESMKDYDFYGFPINFNAKNRYLFGHQTWLLE
ncbi:hypothetical protein FJ365_00385 [Candidatus Dependentiae bacterium]|nr:hypothetical protein [Candidatus Dependentiae bacterium]